MTYGPWRRVYVWFQHPEFINLGKMVKHVRFEARRG